MSGADFDNGVRHTASNVFKFIEIDPKLLNPRDPHSHENRDYVREVLEDGLADLVKFVPDAEVNRVIDAALASSPFVERRMLNVPGSVTIDPTRLDARNAHSPVNRDFIRGALNDYITLLGTSMTDAQLDSIIDKALRAPSGSTSYEIKNLSASVVLVTTQSATADSKNELASIASGIRAGRLKTVPGTDAIWDRLTGEHEGEHGNRETLNSPTLRESIIEETRGDLQALKWLRDNGHTKVAQALIDYRVLTAVHSPNPGHATGVALTGGGVSDVTTDYVQAAQQMRSAILQAVSNEHGLGSERNALRMVEYNPGRFIRTVERALDRGEFRAAGMSPDLEDHVKAYIQAFRRQVDGITPPVPSGARASVDLENGTTSTLTIGGVTAPEFFASIADQASVQTVSHNDSAIAETALNASGELSDQVRAVGMKVA
ncbi:MAG: hypothetical protein KDI90_04695 [Alphaproteobacteria bacterium]|nr:hypothetical protein [Alphaproteobacteria bacterium]